MNAAKASSRVLPAGVVALLLVLAGATSARGEAGGGDERDARAAGARVKLRPLLESGLLAGGESDAPAYRESMLRLYGEAGLDLERVPADSARGNRIGLAVAAMLGRDDRRLAIGPRGTWQLRSRWALQAFGGPLWSSEEEESGLFARGWHARAGLLHRDIVSVGLVWQTLPYEVRLPEPRRGRSHAVYASVMAHGTAGALASLGTWGVVLAVGVAVLLSYGGS